MNGKRLPTTLWNEHMPSIRSRLLIFAIAIPLFFAINIAHAQTAESDRHYGPIKNGETLSHVAYRVRPDDSITIEQVMVALYRSNPTSFYRNTIDSLKIGAKLTIPSVEEIRKTDAKQAQYYIWVAPEKGIPPLTEPQSSPSPAAAAPDEAEELQKEIAKLQQSKIKQAQQNRKLRSRINELESRARTLLLEIQVRVQELDVLKKELEQERLKLERHNDARVENNLTQ